LVRRRRRGRIVRLLSPVLSIGLALLPATAFAAAPVTTNFGLAIPIERGPSYNPIVEDGVVLFEVDEAKQGATDLNGDSDATDLVAHYYDSLTGTVTNLELAAVFEKGQAAAGLIVVSTSASPAMVYLVDRSDGSITPLGDGLSPQTDGTVVAWSVSESDAGMILNGDGDTFDYVVQVYDPVTEEKTNLGLARFSSLRVIGGKVLFTTLESEQGGTDLNGDGDATDSVLNVYDSSTGTTTTLPYAVDGGAYPRSDGSYAAFVVVEADQGAGGTDLNGDSDTDDQVVHIYDIAGDSILNTGLAANGVNLVDDIATFSVVEADQGATDLNGDSDASDSVLHTHICSTGTTHNLGLASFDGATRGGLVAFTVYEPYEGGTDLNGDSDASDLVAHAWDSATNTIYNIGVAAYSPLYVGDGFVVLRSNESQQGVDFNGDSDMTDSGLHVWELAGPTLTNAMLGGTGEANIDGNRIAFVVFEELNGNTDLNGDSDTLDAVPFIWDVTTDSATNTELAVLNGYRYSTPALEGDLMAFAVNEDGQDGTDLNGDSDVGLEEWSLYITAPPPIDYGDAPEPTYPTLEASGGASHALPGTLFLGTRLDAESDGQPDADALGDDTAGNDDDDGVTFDSLLTPGGMGEVTVTASEAGGLLNAWIDWDGDGDWSDTGDQIFTDEPLASGDNELTFAIPATALASAKTFARFRVDSGGGLSFTGAAADGEVEDYAVAVVLLDYGDAPSASYPTLLADDGARHLLGAGPILGSAADAEPDGPLNSDGTGDDTGGLVPDDEEGVSFTSALDIGTTASLSVSAFAAGLLDAWIDFDHDGTWESGEQVLSSESVAPGVNPLVVSVPLGLTASAQTFARFRISTAGGLATTGLAADGEVEDYAVAITCPADLTLSGLTVSSALAVEATDTLTATTVTVESAGDLSLTAGSTVAMDNGFGVSGGLSVILDSGADCS
jgi:hypothetical protein